MTMPVLKRTPEMTPQREQPTPWGPFNRPSFPHLRPELTISSPPPAPFHSSLRQEASQVQDSAFRNQSS